MEGELDYSQFRYALYARKSTDDPQRQIRSVDDQIAECRELALRMNLRIVEPPILEKKSAKKPDQRPQFRQMLKDIRNGRYDAILAWNPDRLARNMKEGGEIIDMVDEDIIKDMKFVTHHFSKDANGKMLLGMAFVLSKQYSDNLSQNVKRGVRRNLSEGKASNSKHGYIRGENGLQVPDGKNFDLICDAWKMRSEGTSLEQIADYMNDQGYSRLVKTTGRLVRMDKRILSKIFQDPFFYGILIQTGKEVDLRMVYEFQPAITEDGFMKVQELSNRRIKPYKQKRLTYYPFKTMITCSYCGNHMYAGASKSGKGQKYLYYRCDTDGCKRPKKSIRAKTILDFIYNFLDCGLDFTEADYNRYYKGMTALSESKKNKLVTDLHVKHGRLKNTERELRELSLKIVGFKKQSTVMKYNLEKLEDLGSQKERLVKEVEAIKGQLSSPTDDHLTIEQFLNLAKNAATVVKSADAVIKDQICRLIFLNLTTNEEKVTACQLKEPFETLVKQRQIHSCRQSLTTFELAFDFIKQLVQLPQLEKDMRDYALLTQNQDGSRMFFVL